MNVILLGIYNWCNRHCVMLQYNHFENSFIIAIIGCIIFLFYYQGVTNYTMITG